ncbi:ABC transporter ATP-binding protein [Paenibacillus eucommiae]|uniref:ABC-type multidrug transport system fused ATPase/permease subunit n=1 Tax=Paenibacillus eucommiae TaxID=1355755 RepID=A0ABS4IPC3_9BACL|nr:ABC transporter ATP-binding protein [Paenibacillus eucommiae]MBP1989402.1 ABC-type multidrug transport system fused ATPase/permease subunit [Paenibacillus eucommiae]
MDNLRWMWSHARRIKGLLSLGMVLMALEALSNLASIGFQQTMIDDVLMGGQSERFWPILGAIGAAYLVYSLLFTFGPHVIHLAIAKLSYSMGRQVMDHLHHLPTHTIQKERTADYVYRLTNDLQTCAETGASDPPRLIQQLVTAGVIVFVMAKASPYMLIIMLTFIGLYIVMGKRFGPARKQISSEVSRNRSSLLVHLEEGVSSTREVIAFNREEWEAGIYRNKFAALFDSVMAEGKLMNKQVLLSDPLKWGAHLFVLFFGGLLVMNDQLSLGMFVIAVQFTSRMMESFNSLYQFAMDLAGKVASMERITTVLRGNTIKEGTKIVQDPVHSIQFHSVSFSYGSQKVLSEISFTIGKGQKIAFVGSSGSGKSTISNLLARYFEPSGGEIFVNGIPISDLMRSDWMSKITIVFQEPYLFPDSIRTNLLLGRTDITEERMIEVCQAMLIHEFISGLPNGYETTIGERGVTLSGGQRQRLTLARAVLRDTEVLILDEATSSLDMETERQVQANLDLLRKDRITIIIAHRLSTIRNSDHIFVVNYGSIMESGTHEDLLLLDSVYRALVSKERNEEQMIS